VGLEQGLVVGEQQHGRPRTWRLRSGDKIAMSSTKICMAKSSQSTCMAC
jgi:hypothetical protein